MPGSRTVDYRYAMSEFAPPDAATFQVYKEPLNRFVCHGRSEEYGTPYCAWAISAPFMAG